MQATHYATARNIIGQLNEGATRSIGWIGEGSSAKAYTGRLIDIRCHRKGIMLHVRNDATGNVVRVLWRLYVEAAYLVVSALGDIIEISRAIVDYATARGLDARLSRSGHACVIDGRYYATSTLHVDRYLTQFAR